MKIGFFTDTYLPVTNGICYVIDILRKDLEDAGHEVYVFAPRDVRWMLPSEEKIIRYPAVSLFYRDQFNSFFWPPSELHKIKDLNLDAVIAFTPSLVGGGLGAYTARKLNIPYVIQYGTDLEQYGNFYKLTNLYGALGAAILAPFFLGMGLAEWLDYVTNYFRHSDKSQPYFSSLARNMLLPLHRRSSAVVATSEKIAGKLRRWPIAQNIQTIPTGVNHLVPNEELRQVFAQKHHIYDDDEIVLYAGRLSVEKNLDLLVNGFSILAKERPKAKLLLVGDFQYRQNLEAQVRAFSLEDRVVFAGQIDRADLGAVYSLADVFAFPSLTDCQALVLNEAAHAGLPLVWCDSPSLNPVLIDGITGWQAENNKHDLAAKIGKLLSDKKLAKKMGLAAKAEAEKYTEKKQTDRIEKLLKDLIYKN